MPFPLAPSPPPAGGLAAVFSGFWSGWVLPQFGQTAILLTRIYSEMPGAFPAADWDARRAGSTSFIAGDYGVGWGCGDRLGYLAPVAITCAKNNYFRQETVTNSGLIIYMGPMVLYMPPLYLRKGDVLVFSDGRYAIGDTIDPAQVMGQTVISGAKMEARSEDDVVYTIPLT